MENKENCELIQDLLLNYMDGLLNESTKQLVKNHLENCSNCSEKLKEFQDDIECNNIQDKEIDYLKKYKRNSTIKAIISPIIIIIVLFLGIYTYKFSVINNLINKQTKSFNSENFYVESISVATKSDILFTTKTWYKDGKYKTIRYENDKIIETIYGKTNSDTYTAIDETNKTATIFYNYFKTQKSSLFPSSNPISHNMNLMLKLGAPFYWNVSKDTETLGKEYYIINSQKGRSNLWIDKTNGTILQKSGYSYNVEYYDNTNIIKGLHDDITQYSYNFNSVTDEDVNIPDLSNFTVLENKTIHNLIEEANQKLLTNHK